MRKNLVYFPVLLLLWQSFPVFAQPGVSAVGVVKKKKESFLHNLTSISTDSAIVFPLARCFESGVSTIHTSITTNDKLTALEKDKAIRSLVYFIEELGNKVAKKRSGIYDIPGDLDAYNSILTALLNDEPFIPLFGSMDPQRSQLMAAVFSQYKESSLFNDIAVYKRLVSSPEFILRFLESKPGFRFADSLLLKTAAYDPMKIIYYLKKNKSNALQNKIRNATDIYLQQMVAFSDHKNASELLPFVTQIAGKRILPEEVLEKRAQPLQYFQLLINTLQESNSAGNGDIFFQQPLRNGIRQKALSFYVNEINELHNATEAVRFASVKDLRPQDIYYIITRGGDELYTSSYLGLYKRLIGHFKEQTADSLFDIVQHDDLRNFIRLAANYNVLADLLQQMSPGRAREILQRFIAGIESDENTALEKAMDIADSFVALNSAPGISEIIQAELQYNLKRCELGSHYLGIRLYSILSGMFDMVKQEGGMKKVWAMLGDYELLKQETLKNKNNEIIQLVLFYGDEDGVASFNNFSKLYTDKNKWEITKNDNWISIRSLSEQPVVIYANRPLDISEEMDLKAQDSLIAFLKDQSLEPTILIHRGHSYHLDKTLRRLTPSARLAILGSCGSYNKSISIASINPDVQVIGSKKMGSKSINDPMIDVINEALINKKDLVWPEIWAALAKRFAKDGAAINIFNEYFPPSNNLGLFVLKLFNYYDRVVN
jgi:hypothetical protein